MRRVGILFGAVLACLTFVGVCHGEVAFSSDRDGDLDIFAMADDGSDIRQITDSPRGDFRPAWSPSAREFVFVSSRDGSDEAYTMTADGQHVDHVGPLWGPTWSPDGTQIAGSAFHPQLAPSVMVPAIYTVATGKTRMFLDVLYPDLFLRPAWSPDGSRIYAGGDMVDVNTGAATLGFGHRDGVTLPRGSSDWAPDGRTIAIGAGGAIYVIDAADGRMIRELARHPEWDGTPSWSPDGRHIVFASRRTGDVDIYVMDRYGRDIRNLTQRPGRDWTPDWSPIPENPPPVHHFGKSLFSWGFLRGFGRVR